MSSRAFLAVAAIASGACAHQGPAQRQLPALMLTPAADRGTLISVRPSEPRSVPPAGVAHIPPGHGDGPFAPLAPYTFVIDGRIVARVRTQADTLELRQLRSLDPKDIESIDVVRDSIARVRYPESVGNAIVIRLTQKHGTSPRR